MRRKVVLAALLIVSAMVLPLMSQIWLIGYCLACQITVCPEGCEQGDFLRRPFAVCATCVIDSNNSSEDNSYTYACTACNYVAFECKPIDPQKSCPPYRLDVQPFHNVAGSRPFKCELIAPMIFICVEN